MAQARHLYANTSLQGNDRVVAVLLRTAVERAAWDAVVGTAARGEPLTGRGLFLCVRVERGIEAARRAETLWGVLSDALHHNPYEMRRTSAEVHAWFESADEVLQALRGHQA